MTLKRLQAGEADSGDRVDVRAIPTPLATPSPFQSIGPIAGPSIAPAPVA